MNLVLEVKKTLRTEDLSDSYDHLWQVNMLYYAAIEKELPNTCMKLSLSISKSVRDFPLLW